MHLRRVELVNFRRYRRAEVELPDGIIGFVGRNGAGKSTLIEALVWTLYGHEAARTSKELIRNSGAGAGEECRVTLEYDLDGQAFRVTRRMRGTGLLTDLIVESGGQALVAGGSNSSAQGTAFLERLVGMDREAFLTSVVALQGELNQLSGRSPADRKRLIGRMLGIDLIDEAIRRTREERRTAELELKYLREALEPESALRTRRDELVETLDVARRSLETAAKERADREEEIRLTDADLQRLRAAAVAAAEITERVEQSRRSLAEADGRARALEGELEKLAVEPAALERLRTRVRELEAEAAALEELERVRERWLRAEEAAKSERRMRSEIERLGRQASGLERLQRRHDALEAEMADAARQREDLARRHGELTAKAGSAAEELERMGRQRSAFEDRAASLARLGDRAVCPLCERPLRGALETLQGKHEEEFRALARSITDVEGRRTGLVADLKALEPQVARASAEERRRQSMRESLRRDLEGARAAAETLDLRRQELAEHLAARGPTDEISWNPAAYDRAREASRLLVAVRTDLVRSEERLRQRERLVALRAVAESERDQARSALEAAERALAATGADPVRLRTLEEHIAGLRRTLEELGRAESTQTERRRMAEQELGRVEEALAAAGERRRRAKELEERTVLLEFLAASHGDKGFLAAFKGHLMARIRPALASAASNLLGRMTDGRYTEIELDDDYNVSVYDQGKPQPLERFSGGETDVVGLSLRLAINELVARIRGRAHLGFVALDEVFASQDAERRISVLAALKSLQPVFRQVLLITHHEEVQERLENVVAVLPDGPGGSRLVPSWGTKGFEAPASS